MSFFKHIHTMKYLNELKFAKEIAKKTGTIQLKRINENHQIEYKGAIDIVTEVDKECETFICDSINKNFSSDDILAEEGGNKNTGSKRKWIIDPLDGTVNYAHRFPFFAVSIALEVDDEVVVGAVYDPIRNELFSATKGLGATLNDKTINTSTTKSLNKALLATGFAYNVQDKGVPDNLNNFSKFIKKARAVRRPGSAALDLAYIACGRLDGFWELFLKPWDIAAAQLIIIEAGGKVSDFSGKSLNIYGTEILVSNGRVHDEMQGVLLDGK